MSQKKITFLVVSDRKGVTRKFVISSAWLKAFVAFCVIVLVLFSVVVLDYLGLVVQTSENHNLRLKNTQMREQVASLEGKLHLLEGEMEYFRNFITKLKSMIIPSSTNTNLSLDRTGIGFLEGKNLSPPQKGLEQFLPASDLFFKSPPLDLVKGELAIEDKRDFALLSIRLDQVIEDSKMEKQDALKLWEWFSQKQSLLQATPSIRPTNGWVTSGFGYRISPYTNRPSMHQGLDIAALPGTPVRASGDGEVVYKGYDEGYGNLISIDHGYGMITRYGHNSKVFVEVGQKIKRGEVIATVGDTGRSTGPHLHYEVRLNDIPVDPEKYILSQ